MVARMTRSDATFRSSLLTWALVVIQFAVFSFLLVVFVVGLVEHAPLTHRVALSPLDYYIGIPIALLLTVAGMGVVEERVVLLMIGDETGVTIWRRSGRTRIAQGANQWSPGEEHLQCEVGADGLHRRRGNTSFDRRIPREGLDGDFLEFGKLPRVIPAALWRCQGD